MKLRFDSRAIDPHDPMRLANRIASLIAYAPKGASRSEVKKLVVDKCREDGYSDDEILSAYVVAKMQSEKKPIGTRRRTASSGEGET